jgi:chromosomal replication initiation ATPase DnaA
MEDVDGKIMTQPEKIEYIIKGSCEFFGIARNKFRCLTSSRSPIWHKKRHIIGVLHDYTAMSLREIAENLGYKEHTSILYHYKCLKRELSNEFYGYDKTKLVHKELLTYLKL